MKTAFNNFAENKILVFVLLVLVPTIVYIKSLFFGFTPMDEQWMIVNNGAYLANKQSFFDAFTTPLAGLYYRPLFLMTIIVDYHLGELSPFIYHFTNLLWHLAAVLLLLKFLVINGVEKTAAFFCSLVFAVHPITLHAVAWVPGRNDAMLCVFVLASLICLHQYFIKNKLGFLIAHIVFFICALLTKENGIVLPLIYLFYCIINKVNKRSVFIYLIFWSIISFCWIFLRMKIASQLPIGNGTLMDNIISFLKGMLIYLGKDVFPVNLSVFPTVTNSPILFGVIVIILIFIIWFKPGLKNKPVAYFGLMLFFLLLLIPVWYGASKGIGEQFEHRGYTSLAGLLLFVSQIKFDFEKRSAQILFAGIIVLLSVKTFSRMDVYKDNIAFLKEGIKSAPDYYFFQLQYADMLYAKANYQEAIPYYTKALELRPDKIGIYNNRGSSYFYLGMFKEAIYDFTMSIEKAPFKKEYYLNRCAAYNKIGDVNNAMKDLNFLLDCCANSVPEALASEIKQKWAALNSLLPNK